MAHHKQIINFTELFNELRDIAASWSELGIQIGVPKSEIDKIKRKTRDDPNESLTEVLHYWVHNKRGGWKDICSALNKMRESVLASTIAETHNLVPKVKKQPKDCNASMGETTKFECEATGYLPLKYKWFHWKPNSAKEKNSKRNDLEVHNTKKQDEGQYYCVISNDFGSVETKHAKLEIGMLVQPSILRNVLEEVHKDSKIASQLEPKCFKVANHLIKEDKSKVFFAVWNELDGKSCSWRKLANAFHEMECKELSKTCEINQGKDLDEDIFCKIVNSEELAKELAKTLIDSNKGNNDSTETASTLFKRWQNPNWDQLMQALYCTSTFKDQVKTAAKYAGKYLDEANFCNLLGTGVDLEHLCMKLAQNRSGDFALRFLETTVSIWFNRERYADNWTTWRKLAALIESTPCTADSEDCYLNYHIGTLLRSKTGVGLTMTFQKLEAVVKDVNHKPLNDLINSIAYADYWVRRPNPFNILLEKWKPLYSSWERLAQLAETLKDERGYLTAQSIRALSGSGGIPEVMNFFIRENKNTFVKGERITFLCAARGAAPLSYKWKCNGSTVTVGTNAYKLETTATEGGEYYCEVKNDLDVVETEHIKVIVGYRPKCAIKFDGKMRSNGEALYVKRDHDAKLICIAEGSKPLIYVWRFKDEAVSTQEPECLTIKKATKDDEGRYECTVENQLGLGKATTAVNISVGDPPAISRTSIEGIWKKNFEIGTKLVLCCQATGSEPLLYSWKHNRGKQYDGEKVEITAEDETDGSYTCTVTNKFGEVSSENPVVIKVGTRPYIENEPPSVKGELIPGEQVTLSCRAPRGKTPLQFEWLLNNQLLQKTNQIMVDERESNYIIEHMADSDQGKYKCRVINAFGSAISPDVELKLGITVDAVMEEIKEKVATQWCVFGVLLGVPKSTLDWIARGYCASHGDDEYALREVVRAWLEEKESLDKSKSKNWDSVQEVVRKIGHEDLAGSIESKKPYIRHIEVQGNLKSNEFVKLVCKASDSECEYEWKHNDEILEGENGKEHDILSMEKCHEGTYQCIVHNEYGKAMKSVKLAFGSTPKEVAENQVKQKQPAIKHSAKDMKDLFSTLTKYVKELLSSTGDSNDTAVSKCFASLYLFSEHVLASDEREELHDIDSVFRVFGQYWSFRRLHLLETVVNQFSSEEGSSQEGDSKEAAMVFEKVKSKIEEYKVLLEEYENATRLCELTHELEKLEKESPNIPPFMKPFRLKLESSWASCSVKDVDSLLCYLLPSAISPSFVWFASAHKCQENGLMSQTLNYFVLQSMDSALDAAVKKTSTIFSSLGILSVQVKDSIYCQPALEPTQPPLKAASPGARDSPEDDDADSKEEELKLLLELEKRLGELNQRFQDKMDVYDQKHHTALEDDKKAKDSQIKSVNLALKTLKQDFDNLRKEVTRKDIPSKSDIGDLQNKLDATDQNIKDMQLKDKAISTSVGKEATERKHLEANMTLKLEKLQEEFTSYKREMNPYRQQLEQLQKKHEELQRNYQEVLKNYETFKTALLADHLRDVKTKH